MPLAPSGAASALPRMPLLTELRRQPQRQPINIALRTERGKRKFVWKSMARALRFTPSLRHVLKNLLHRDPQNGERVRRERKSNLARWNRKLPFHGRDFRRLIQTVLGLEIGAGQDESLPRWTNFGRPHEVDVNFFWRGVCVHEFER